MGVFLLFEDFDLLLPPPPDSEPAIVGTSTNRTKYSKTKTLTQRNNEIKLAVCLVSKHNRKLADPRVVPAHDRPNILHTLPVTVPCVSRVS